MPPADVALASAAIPASPCEFTKDAEGRRIIQIETIGKGIGVGADEAARMEAENRLGGRVGAFDDPGRIHGDDAFADCIHDLAQMFLACRHRHQGAIALGHVACHQHHRRRPVAGRVLVG